MIRLYRKSMAPTIGCYDTNVLMHAFSWIHSLPRKELANRPEAAPVVNCSSCHHSSLLAMNESPLDELALPKRLPRSSLVLVLQHRSDIKAWPRSPIVDRLVGSPAKERSFHRLLIDDLKMMKVLSMLRSDHFGGEIDPQHHSKYIESPDLRLNKFSLVDRMIV
jgi:hypothetical protein